MAGMMGSWSVWCKEGVFDVGMEGKMRRINNAPLPKPLHNLLAAKRLLFRAGRQPENRNRLGTDVLMAGMMGSWSVWCKEGVFDVGMEGKPERNPNLHLLQNIPLRLPLHPNIKHPLLTPNTPRPHHPLD
jgi:hypothetical protein